MGVLRFSVRYFYVPLLLLGVNGLAIWLVANGFNWWLLALLYPLAVLVSLAAEFILPYERAFNRPDRDIGRDILYYFTYELSVFNSVVLLPVIVLLRPWDSVWPHDWPLWQQIMAAILLADFGFMFVHYLSHKIGWLWRFHAPHHSATRLYSFNGLIKHPVQITLEIVISSTPLILLGISQEVALLLGFAAGVQLLLQHSNADYRLGPFTYLLAIAPVHRFHHVRQAGKGDVNFGLFLTVWDHLFGTFKFDRGAHFRMGDFGIEDMPDYPKSWWRHMIFPFQQQKPPAEQDTKVQPAE